MKQNGNVPRTVFGEGVFREFYGFNAMVHQMFLSGLHICMSFNAARNAWFVIVMGVKSCF